LSLKTELRKLKKSELVREVIRLMEVNNLLTERMEKIEALLRQYDNPNTPSSKKRFKENTNKGKKGGKRFPGRKKGHKGAGIRLPKPDKTVEHTLNTPGLEHIGTRVKTVIDFVDKPILVTRHIIHLYRDEEGNLVVPQVDLPEGVYGKNLQAFVCLLKGKLGASHDGIADLIKSIRNDLSYCAATNLSLTDKIARALKSVRQAILEEVRKAFYCNADETGLRQDGENGYVWVFCTPTHVLYETDLSRSGKVPKRVLGEDYDNFVVCDGWQGYNGYKRQRCWPHLLRELDALAEDNEEVKIQADYLHEIYKQALEAKHKPPDERLRFVEKMNGITELPHLIEVLSRTSGCGEFATKLENARPYLFTGVIHPEIPLDNNHAERQLRKVVIHRKLMGCIRNEKGQRFIENGLSAIQTWHLQGKNIYDELKPFAS